MGLSNPTAVLHLMKFGSKGPTSKIHKFLDSLCAFCLTYLSFFIGLRFEHPRNPKETWQHVLISIVVADWLQ